ncbi:cytochrome C oxidase subunit IV family protein [Hyalangium gracile]|uniref:cytochrome C oxidase subunit IV family protein n=1 Tax=Hyalangium gracile TaxID=394092 RepID=UPI001CCB0B2B|nr:cytochrome C oxidase subunit IV family protein [Hyalangium gracile]
MSVANESQQEDRNMKEHHSAAPYWIVWAALMFFTGLTVVTGRMHFELALPVALAIATTKGMLVLLIFMHLKDHKGANRLVMGVSFLFVIFMLIMPLADFATRFRPANPAGSHLSDLPDLNFIEGKTGAHGGAHGAGNTTPGGHPAPTGH